ncbi:hypothetical protein BA897_00420 [Spiribacter roseus]|nr:hypothetical protein BA897_00420 [Spiribacter roseus]
MDATEAAIAHDHHPVAGLNGGKDRVNQGLQVGAPMATGAERGERGADIPVQIGRCQDEGLIRRLKGIAQAVLVDPLAHGVGAGLEHGDQPPGPGVGGEGLEGGRNGRGVMGEIIQNLDTSGLATPLQTPADTPEAGQCGDAIGHGQAGMARCKQGGGGVHGVVPAGQRRLPVPVPQLPAISGGMQGEVTVVALAKADRPAPAARRQDVRQGGIIGVHHDAAGAGYRA